MRLVDERFSTTEAHTVLQAVGRSARKRREIVDAVAAVVILQSAVDQEKSTGMPAGTLLHPAPEAPA